MKSDKYVVSKSISQEEEHWSTKMRQQKFLSGKRAWKQNMETCPQNQLNVSRKAA